ncbi:MAG TPA: T9SS type A sorting domain-containing protein, partial [Hanamia sp.]
NAYWSIPATGGTNYTYSLKLFYDPSILGKITSPQDMVINKKEINVPGTWTVITPTINNVAAQTLNVNGQTSFSEFTATDALHTLPVGIVLNGRQSGNDFKLTWEDPNAVNNISYGIERSKDGITFGNIGNIAANTAINYQYTDVAVFKTAPVFYYRLRITNNVNKISYSNIVTFRNGAFNGEEIAKVYPNPFTKQITLEISSGKDQTISLTLLSANGNTVTNSELKIAKGNSVINMNLPNNIASGTYVLRIITEKGSYSFKLVKN